MSAHHVAGVLSVETRVIRDRGARGGQDRIPREGGIPVAVGQSAWPPQSSPGAAGTPGDCRPVAVSAAVHALTAASNSPFQSVKFDTTGLGTDSLGKKSSEFFGT